MSIDRTAERDAIHAAIQRLLAGTSTRSTGALTVVQLTAEASVKRWILTHHEVVSVGGEVTYLGLGRMPREWVGLVPWVGTEAERGRGGRLCCPSRPRIADRTESDRPRRTGIDRLVHERTPQRTRLRTSAPAIRSTPELGTHHHDDPTPHPQEPPAPTTGPRSAAPLREPTVSTPASLRVFSTPFLFENAERQGVPPAVPYPCRVSKSPLVRHTELGQHSGGAEIPRVTGGEDSMKPQLNEAALQKLAPDSCANALPPYPRMHDVGDLALALRVTADMQLAHTNNVVPEARYMGEPLLGCARPSLDCGLHEIACLVLSVRSPRLETTSLWETGPRVNGPPVIKRDLVQGHRVLTHGLILSTGVRQGYGFKNTHSLISWAAITIMIRRITRRASRRSGQPDSREAARD